MKKETLEHLPRSEKLLKFLGRGNMLGLNEFWGRIVEHKKGNDFSEEQQLNLTLAYLEPLLREGKLKGKVCVYLKGEKQLLEFLENNPGHPDEKYLKQLIKDKSDVLEGKAVAIVREKECPPSEASELVEAIKKRRGECKSNDTKRIFEQQLVWFTLPENEREW